MLCDAVAVHVAFVLTLGAMMVGPDAPGVRGLEPAQQWHRPGAAPCPLAPKAPMPPTANDSEIGTQQGQIMIKGFCTFSAIVATGPESDAHHRR